MEDQEKKAPKKKAEPAKNLVYSINCRLEGFGFIGGLPVTKEIDKALNEALSRAGTTAKDYHLEIK